MAGTRLAVRGLLAASLGLVVAELVWGEPGEDLRMWAGIAAGMAALNAGMRPRVSGALEDAGPIRSRLIPTLPMAECVAWACLGGAILLDRPLAWVVLLAGLPLLIVVNARRQANEILEETLGRCPLCLHRPLQWGPQPPFPRTATWWRVPRGLPTTVVCPGCSATWDLGWRSGPARTLDWLQLRAAGGRTDQDLVPILVMMRKPSQWLSWVRSHTNDELDARQAPVLPPPLMVPAPGDSPEEPGLATLMAVARRNAQRSMPEVGFGLGLALRVALVGVFIGVLTLTRSDLAGQLLLAPIIAVAVLGDRQRRARAALLSAFARCPICLHRDIWWDMRLGRARDRVGCAACGAEWEMGRQVRLLGTLNRLALIEPGAVMTDEMRQSLPTTLSPADWRRWVEGRMAAVLDGEEPPTPAAQAV